MTEIDLVMDGNDRIRVNVHADQEYSFTGTITGVARDGQFFHLIGIMEENKDADHN